MAERLADAVSPYLQAHADNPVDWYPWGPDAFRAAAERDVPVLISIGYATCHWCHVMARESFSDPEIARILNEGFVAIKVDREEHPGVDGSYLAAASAFTRQLGWPLTVFADAQGRAFYAGTYFPPRSVQGVPAFRDVLGAVSEAWRDRRGELRQTAEAVAAAVAGASVVGEGTGLPDLPALAGAAERLAADEDPQHGGFGGAPKFPVAPVLAFLAATGGGSRALAARTMRRMGASALRDPVEGGFFRYSTRADWTEPHYERMLSDNALLLGMAADLWRAGPREPWLADLAAGLTSFLSTVMRLPSGMFASAQDSESVIDGRRDEGGYYRRDALARAELAPPALDEKVLTGWNGLAIGGLARAGAVFDDPTAIATAARAADALIAAHLRPDGSLVRASRDGRESDARAALEDPGMLAEGLIELSLATGDVRWAGTARALVDSAIAAAGGGVPFGVPGGADPVLDAHGLALPPDPAEGATPSGVTSMARAAWLLSALGAGTRYLEAAEAAMSGVAAIAIERPIAFGAALALMTELAAPLVQVVTVLPDAGEAVEPGVEPGTAALIDATRRHEASVAAVVTESQARAFAEAGFELFEARTAGGAGLAYRCESFVCALPVGDAGALDRLAGD
ncbi:thioredoxin domain-containing protein [Agromyces aerolatus]|uniref:thioredoxin domain-containing protein n=1 Tax=Agromyces sp. LY-1074 TaxID=3074080 RepID=UPI002857A6B0|nr:MULTISPECIES: DUF255 domain-containing protein [unclassified Agromyces]MDR5698777.1 DUF255 domain-containing protein [Agromyces sp. LY-1074]MDR5705445.1 DUF255 domain-containing protein [Agromyces sp. LY-1358]